MEIKEAKEYLKVDGDDEDNLISSLLLATQSYIKNATGIVREMIKDDGPLLELYNLTLKLLLSHWYENRSAETTGANFHKLNFSLDSLFLQLEAEYLKMKRDGTI